MLSFVFNESDAPLGIPFVLNIKEDAVRKRVARGSKEFKRLYRPGSEIK